MPQEEEDKEEGSPLPQIPQAPEVYPGPLSIWKNANLNATERQIEQRFVQQLQSDLAYWMRIYRARNGRLLDTDLARGLSADWNNTNRNRARYSTAVHNPSSALIDALYRQMLSEAAEPGRDLIVFMAGGGGAGKTTAVKTVAASLLDKAHLVYDTTLSRYESAAEKIRAALDEGWAVVILYVHRSFEDAVRGVIDRAVETGRAVPLNVLAADHANAPQTVLHLTRDYAGNERVQIFVIDNSKPDANQAAIVENGAVDFLEKTAHNDSKILYRRAQEVLKDESKNRAGTLRAIPVYILAALRQTYVRRTRP
jgi:predicted ABC-type ATPase